jgi:peptidoglycan/LPS O-acetylase OafA/YrhL
MWGWAGVEIFFVISGFVIPYAMFQKKYTLKNFPVFLKKRIIRIEPPYLISIVLVLLLNFVSTLSPYFRGAPFSVDWYNLACHVAYLNIFTDQLWLNPVYWSLAIELQYYLLIALAFTLVISEKIYLRIVFFAVFGALTFLPLPENKFIFIYAGFFLAGNLLFQIACGIITKMEFWGLLLITIVLLWYRHGMGMTVIALSTLAIIAFIDKIPRFFRFLGHISYSLYLLHVPIGGRIINISERFVQNQMMREIFVGIIFVVCILVSAMFYKYIEKIFKRLSSNIKYKDKKKVAIDPVIAGN